MTIVFLIYSEKSKRFFLIVNNVKILSEKDKKNTEGAFGTLKI